MTRGRIGYLLRRYSYVSPAADHGERQVSFCIGERKENIQLNDEDVFVLKIFQKSLKNEKDETIKKALVENIVKGWNDKFVIMQNPFSKSTFYRLKEGLLDKIYHFCIYEGMVNFREIEREKII